MAEPAGSWLQLVYKCSNYEIRKIRRPCFFAVVGLGTTHTLLAKTFYWQVVYISHRESKD